MTDLRAQLQSSLGEAYTIERELGGGGMSRVFVATEKALGRQVVIKVLPSEMAGAVSIERFKREIAVAARLQQANIVPVLSAGDSGGVPYFTMPYVTGESLRARLASGGELPIPEAVGILKEVARALAYAHEHGVVHRDIKPDNVLLSGGSAMVTDFGVAKALSAATTAAGEQLTGTGLAIGTPAYMSPEQATGDPLTDHRADIYSFGCLAYELLAGAAPFAGRSPQQTIAAQMTEAPDPVERRRPAVPSQLAALVARCLAKSPADRPQGVAEVISALEQASLTPDAARARPVPVSRSRVPLALTVTTVVLVGIALLLAPFTRRGMRGTRTIVVLPFENATRDTALDYLAEGMSDEIRGQLTGMGVSVMSRASSLTFRDRNRDLAEMGAKLHATDVVSGSVRAGGGELHVNVELIRVSDGSAAWSGKFDRAVGDFAWVQDSITRAIASSLRVQLTDVVVGGVGSGDARGTSDFAAYDAFLKGEYHRRRLDFAPSIAYLRTAVTRDPKFVRAWASLATTLAFAPIDGRTSADSVRPLASESLDRAIALEPTHPQVLIARGMLLNLQLRLDEAREVFKHSIERRPDDAEAHLALGLVLAMLGRLDDARASVQRSLALDPLSTDALTAHQYLLYARREYRQAIDATPAILALDPRSTLALLDLALAYAFAGKPDSAAAAAQQALDIDPFSFGARAWAMVAFASAGRWNDVDAQRTYLARETSNSPNYIEMIQFIVYGNYDAAMNSARQAVTRREPLIMATFMGCDPVLSPLIARPEYATVLAPIGAKPCQPVEHWPIKPRPR